MQNLPRVSLVTVRNLKSAWDPLHLESTQRCPANAQPEYTATAIQNLIEEVHDRLRGRRESKLDVYQLGLHLYKLHLYNQNPRANNTIRRSYASSHRRSRR